MKQMTALTASLMFVALSAAAHAEPVKLGQPEKGTPITTVKDGKSKIQITTTGISVDDGDEVAEAGDQDEAAGSHRKDLLLKMGPVKAKTVLSELEDILVPGMFFLFLVAVILGGKYFASRNEQRRLELLRLMVEKGQPVPENVVNQILSPQPAAEADSVRQAYKRTRNAYAFTIAGVALIGYALIFNQWSNSSILVPGLVFIAFGVGGLAGLYMHKRDEKISG
jgi:hypothetical protein